MPFSLEKLSITSSARLLGNGIHLPGVMTWVMWVFSHIKHREPGPAGSSRNLFHAISLYPEDPPSEDDSEGTQ
eukprot:9561369-Alexandrium_andersonii.AAC.1